MKPNIKELKLTSHAVSRIEERFKTKGHSAALQLCKSLLGKAQYLGETQSEDGGKAYTFGVDGVAIYISIEDPTLVKSVVPVRERSYIPKDEERKEILLRPQLIKLYRTELNKCSRMEKSRNKKYMELEIKSELEIAQLKYRAYKSRSANVKKECNMKIDEIMNSLKEYKLKTEELSSNKRTLTKVLTTLL